MHKSCQFLCKKYVEYIHSLQNVYILDRQLVECVDNTDLVSLTKQISAYSQKGKLDDARKVFDKMAHRDSVAWNVMIRGYVENGRIRDAREIFDRMYERNTVSWNSMIMGYVRERKMHVALKLFLMMPLKDKDIISWTTIISGFAQDSELANAWQLFKQMPEHNPVSWSSIISGFQQNGLAAETLILFKEMLSVGTQPTPHSFTSALAASADLEALSRGQQLYAQVLKRGFGSNTHVGNSAISMFIKSGSLDNARGVFHGMPRPDMVTWNSMIMGYGQHGYGPEAIMVFHQMQKAGFQPDRISFLGVLHGCSHCGLVEEGWLYFNSMEKDHEVAPEPGHYACMVDILARAGLLKEAAEMIDRMPFEPVAIFWRTLLNGCRIFRNLELGVYAADRVLEREPDNTAACLMAMEMYAAVGQWTETVKLRRLMREREAKKEQGCSWIEIKGTTHSFTTRDETHLESDLIYKILDLLAYDVAGCWIDFLEELKSGY
ncbi:pentatricopeptide repeat-containing protein At4g02750-like [Magnolia sinica]|uniref:pentatricopeptide repeat-containing protein At4g02750-like n=1 Tax=Magnolia sinica TaxID=86752 RepID=UPI00265A94B8|nr:pentatricopeptide repeat-containing protein At4g02750-like [Magnolia sinica]